MKIIGLTLLVLIFLVLSSNVCSSKTYRIKSVSEYKNSSKSISSGDTVIWLSGTYSDMKWLIDNDGIVVIAQKPGSVTFNGSSAVSIHSDNVTFSGFQFIGGSISSNVVEVSGNNNKVSDVNIAGYASHYYFHITALGRHNLVENCSFENKPQAPAGKEGSSIFQVSVDSLNPGYNILRSCSFKDHTAPPNAGGDYGMEALRIGYSFQAKFISRTLVEYCYFTKCNGDGEIISNKARQNVIRYNTFFDNGESHLTLRHGGENVVYGNFFTGGAGIRIKEGQHQMVYNNYFNTGDFFSIRLENYRIDPLDDIRIAYNTFAGSGPMRLGGKGDFKPKNVGIYGNLFISPAGKLVDDPTGTETFEKNGVALGSLPEMPGIYMVKIEVLKNGSGYFQPSGKITGDKKETAAFSLLDVPDLDDDPQVKLDIAGNRRSEKGKSAGCFEPGRNSSPTKPWVDAKNIGPVYLR